MAVQLILSKEARRSIDEQLISYEENDDQGGIELADRWLNRLQDALDDLCTNPMRHGFAPENGRWRPEVLIRQMRFRPWKGRPGWRVLYTVTEDRLMMLQLRHQKQRLLDDDDS